MKNLEKIEQHLRKSLEKENLIIYNLRMYQEELRNYLEVVLLSKDGEKLSLDDVVYYTPIISNLIDEVDAEDDNYFLDIYSPQSDLPLFQLEHYQKAVSKKVSVSLKDDVISGTLLEVKNSKIYIKGKKEIKEINFIDIKDGIVKGEELK